MVNKKIMEPGGRLKRIFLAAVIGALGVNLSFGAFSKNDAGTSAAQYLKLGAGARVTALGDAGAALAGDSTAIYWNPAGLNGITARSATVMHAVWLEDISYDWASFALPYGDRGVFGLGAQYLSYGSIKKLDSTGLETGELNPSDLCVALSYAKSFRGLDLGVNVKYVSLKIQNSASAYAADLGVQYKVKSASDHKFTLGFAAQNMGTKVKFASKEDSLPMNFKFGGAYSLKDNWLAVLDVNAPVDNAVNVGAGTEYDLKIKEKLELFGRAGYNTRSLDAGGLSGVTAGIGVKYLDYCFDYAYVPYGDLGSTQRLSLTVKF